MTVKHRIPCFDAEILVKVSGGEEAVYQVTIQSAQNPLGSGNPLGGFSTMEEAIGRAERFCSFYSAARESGYYLRSDMFVKPDRADISVASVMDGSMTPERLKSLIEEQTV